MAEGYEIAEGHLDITADPTSAWRNVQAFLQRVDRELHEQEDDFEASGRRAGRRYSEGLEDGLGGPHGGNLINDLVLGGAGGGGGGAAPGGGGGGGFIEGLFGGLRSGLNSILTEIREIISDLNAALQGMGGGDGPLSALQDSFNDLLTNIRSGFTSMISYMHGTWTRLIGVITGGGGPSPFAGWITSIRTMWTRFTTWASGALGATWTRVRTFFASMGSSLTSFWTRFVAWSTAAFGTLRVLSAAFWARFRGWAMTTFTSLALVAGILFSRMRVWAAGVFSRMRTWFSGIWSSASTRIRALWTRFTTWASSAFSTVSGWFTSLWSSISSGASAAWTQLQSIFSGLGGAAGPVLQIAVMASMIPIVLGLGGAVLQLSAALLALPAAIGILAAAIAPLIVGLKGFSEAVGAGLSGDVNKFNEALKKLTPSARAVAKEFVKLGPVLKSIKSATQEALFKPLIGTIKPLATTLFPALRTGMELVAGALGRMLAGFVKLLGANDIVEAIGDVFETTGRIIDRLGPPLTDLFGNLFGVTEKGLPFVERFFDALANGIQMAADWLSKIQQDGSMTSWLERAWSIAQDVWAILVQLGLAVKNIFADSGDEGQSFLQGLAESLEKLNKWLSSADGKETLDDIADTLFLVGIVIDKMLWQIGLLGDAWLKTKIAAITAWNAIKIAWDWIQKASAATWAWIKDIAKVTWDWIKDAASAVGDFFVGLGRWFADAYNTVVGWGGALVEWFTKIPGWIGEFFSNLPGWIAAGLAAMRDAIFYSIGYVIGLIFNLFLSIPGMLAAAWEWIKSATATGAAAVSNAVTTWASNVWTSFLKLGSDILSAIDSAWDAAYESTVRGLTAAWEWISAFPGKVGEALSALPGQVGKWFSDTWNRGRENTSKGVTDTVGEVRKLPGKIADALSGAGTWLYETGKNMIRGLIDGISDMWGWAVGQAKAAATAIKDGFLDALDVGSPSRVMQMEVGRWILPGVMQGITDTIPDATRYMGAVANMLVEGFQPVVNVAAPTVHTGDTMLSVDLGEGIRQVVPLVITRNPRVVAAANASGARQRTGWVNTARGTVNR